MRRRPPGVAALGATLSIAVTVALAAPAVTLPVAAGGPPGAAQCPMFPPDNVWNRDISSLPVHPSSAAWIASMGGTSQLLHPDFGPSGTSLPYGIPYIVVDGSHPRIPVTFDYADESDPGPYPFGSDTPIEGGASSTGDRHALMLDSSTCTLYELYDAHYDGVHNTATAGSGAVFHLTSDMLRPDGWTSADAAGLPILPGLIRRDEVAAGVIPHAIRMTAAQTDTSFLWPARHQAGAAADASLPPMGARFRLRASFDISHFSTEAQVVLTAMKHYGLIVADNGSNWYFGGAAEDGWSNSVLDELKTIPAGAFDAVDESSLMVSPDSGQTRPPVMLPPIAVRGTDGATWVESGGAFWPWGGGTPYPPLLRSTAAGVTAYVTGNDGAVWSRTASSGWAPLTAPGTRCTSRPAVTSAAGVLTLACRGGDGAVWVGTGPDGPPHGQVGSFRSWGGGISGSPALTLQGQLLARGLDGRIWQRSAGSGWTTTGWACTAPPTVSAITPTLQRFGCVGADGAVWTADLTGAGWGAATSWGGRATGVVGVSTRGMVAQGADGAVWFDPGNGWGWVGGSAVGGADAL